MTIGPLPMIMILWMSVLFGILEIYLPERFAGTIGNALDASQDKMGF
jgi:hypothetical protein